MLSQHDPRYYRPRYRPRVRGRLSVAGARESVLEKGIQLDHRARGRARAAHGRPRGAVRVPQGPEGLLPPGAQARRAAGALLLLRRDEPLRHQPLRLRPPQLGREDVHGRDPACLGAIPAAAGAAVSAEADALRRLGCK